MRFINEIYHMGFINECLDHQHVDLDYVEFAYTYHRDQCTSQLLTSKEATNNRESETAQRSISQVIYKMYHCSSRRVIFVE